MPSASDTQAAVERFLTGCREPQLLEPGRPAIPLVEGRFELRLAKGYLQVEAWDDEQLLSRRVVAVGAETRDRLELKTLCLARKPGKLYLLDAARPASRGLQQKGRRLVHQETFRSLLARHFPGWRPESLSTGAFLEESLSPAYPRAILTRGRQSWAAVSAPLGVPADHALSFGLIWLDYSRRARPVEGLALFLPESAAGPTCLRLPCLHHASFRLFLCPDDGSGPAIEADWRDFGNLNAELETAGTQPPVKPQPEALLEAELRANLAVIDPTLLAQPVYGQVPAFGGIERGILDLLGVDRSGRLAVVELKASESIHLPLQALDYWVRVRRHLDRGDFPRLGLFTGIELSPEAPRLLLVAPALRFHSTNERLLRYFRPEVPVEMVGLSSGAAPLRVLFRRDPRRQP